MTTGRGYLTKENDGSNSNYYLYSGDWYRTISSYQWDGGNNGVIDLYSAGSLYGTNVGNADSGVRFIFIFFSSFSSIKNML